MRAPYSANDLKALKSRQSNPKVNRYLCINCANAVALEVRDQTLKCPQCNYAQDVVPQETYTVRDKNSGKVKILARVDDDIKKMRAHK